MHKLKTLPFVVVCFLMVLTVSSCSEDEPKKTAPEGQLEAKVDGADWVSTTASAFVFDGKVSVVGRADDNSSIGFTVTASEKGTFTIPGVSSGPVEDVAMLRPEDADIDNPSYFSADISDATAGEVIISKIDNTNKTISGSFSFKVFRSTPQGETVEIKEGSFNKVPYAEQTAPSMYNGFTASVDGENMLCYYIGASNSGGVTVTAFGYGVNAINLYMPGDVTVGSYSMGSMGSSFYGEYGNGLAMFVSTSGSVQITKHDEARNRIEGKFSFTGAKWPDGGSTVSVTKGSFGITY